MGNAYNPVGSLDPLEDGQEVTFYRDVGKAAGGRMYKQTTGTIRGFGEVPRPHAVIEFDGENSPLAVGPENIEHPDK